MYTILAFLSALGLRRKELCHFSVLSPYPIGIYSKMKEFAPPGKKILSFKNRSHFESVSLFKETNKRSQKLFPFVKMARKLGSCTCINQACPSRGEWPGGALVLGYLQCPVNLDNSRVGAYCTCSWCGWMLFGFFSLAYHLLEMARYRLKCCLKRLLNPNQPTN